MTHEKRFGCESAMLHFTFPVKHRKSKIAEITCVLDQLPITVHSARTASSKSRRNIEHEITIKIPAACFVILSPPSISIFPCHRRGSLYRVSGALFTAHRFLKLSHAASTPTGICITTRESFVIYGGRCHKHGSIDYSFGRSRRYPPSRLQSLPVLALLPFPPKGHTRLFALCALCIPAARGISKSAESRDLCKIDEINFISPPRDAPSQFQSLSVSLKYFAYCHAVILLEIACKV